MATVTSTTNPDVVLIGAGISCLEDRIQELCAKAISAKEHEEMEEAIEELRAALKEHINRIRHRVVTFPSPERRSSTAD